MKICFVGGGMRAGGQERHLSGLANHYAKNGHGVSVINLFKTEQFFQLDKKIQIFWPTIDRNRYQRFIYAVLLIPYVRRAVKKLNPDAILCFGEWFSPFVILSTRFLNIPIFLFEMMGPNLHFGELIELSRKIFYPFAKGVIVQTETAAKIVSKRTGAKHLAIIPNPINVIDAETSLKKKQIISVGRLSKEKGHRTLLRAFSMLRQDDWSLHLIGDGPERTTLEKEVQDLGVSERVTLHGHLKDFSQIIGESEIFVLPSFYEGFPNALLEAMSVPLACISSNCVAGPSDIIQHGKNGLLVEPGNVDELARAIELLISDNELREKLAREAYKVREKYQFDKIAQQYLDFITKSINTR